MNRRRFVALIGSALATPLARAQAKEVRLGLLSASPISPAFMDPILAGLRDRGWIEGTNLVVEARAHGGNFAKALTSAEELVRLHVNAILALSTNSAVAVRKTSARMPVVTLCGDPVAAGLARSLAHPGGSVTGVAIYPRAEMFGKLVDLLRETRPSMRELAILWDLAPPGWPDGPPHLEALQHTAKVLGVRSQVWMVHGQQDLVAALSAIDRGRFDALVVSASGGIHQQPAFGAQIAEIVARRRLLAITNIANQTFVHAGCVLAYSFRVQEILPRLAYFVDKVLRGANPGDIPIEQPTRFDLIINLKTAKAIGLTIPPAVLTRADKIIE
jgi:putative ABC transport system substrate-binding protein